MSFDVGLLLLKEFCYRIGALKLLSYLFKINAPALFRIHKDDINLMQAIYQIFVAYFEDDCADERFCYVSHLGKDALASQPTLSHFFNRINDAILEQFNQILCELWNF